MPQKEKNLKEGKKGFFGKLFEKIDKKLEEKAQKSSCCGTNKDNGSSCC